MATKHVCDRCGKDVDREDLIIFMLIRVEEAEYKSIPESVGIPINENYKSILWPSVPGDDGCEICIDCLGYLKGVIRDCVDHCVSEGV